MKNLFLFILFATFTACESSTEKVIDSNLKTTELKFSEEPITEGICPDGQVSVWTVDITFDMFRKFNLAECKKGLGMCFNFGIRVTHNCRIKSIQAEESANFDPISGTGKAVIIRNDIDKTVTLIFDRSIRNYNLYQNYDFNYFSIAPSCYADFGERLNLVSGNYPLVVDGNYLKYIIPYVE